MTKTPTKHEVHETKNEEPVKKEAPKAAPVEVWVHLPPSQQSAQGPVPKPGEPMRADSPEVVAPKVKKTTMKG